ncbi:hypothetical protein FZ029_04780 [Azospirillum sp. Sh1]|nr:hypothetical protein FZ029_04780 [Azospirillum sp. Sh1]
MNGSRRHPREGGDPGFRSETLKRLDSRIRGNDGREMIVSLWSIAVQPNARALQLPASAVAKPT